jgi:hypothetical protein
MSQPMPRTPCAKELEILKQLVTVYWSRMEKEVWGASLETGKLNEPRLSDLMVLSYAMASTYQGMDQESQLNSGYSPEDLAPWAGEGNFWDVSNAYHDLAVAMEKLANTEEK